MANIVGYLATIYRESRGEGVRDAIVKALQAINNEGTGNASTLNGHSDMYFASAEELRKLYGTDVIITMYPDEFDSNGVYSFEKKYPATKYDLYPQLGPNTSLTQMGQARAAMFIINSTTKNEIKALGTIPTTSIQLAVRVVSK
jgi:hypothetical protein